MKADLHILPRKGERIESNVTVLPTEGSGEQDLLAGLLAYSGNTAAAPALMQHFASLGHVVTAEASQLNAFGMSARDVKLLRLFTALHAPWRVRKCAAVRCWITGER